MITPSLQDDDWPKASWDFWNPDGTQVSTLEQLHKVSGFTKKRLKNMLNLPVAKAMPPSLREELEQLEV